MSGVLLHSFDGERLSRREFRILETSALTQGTPSTLDLEAYLAELPAKLFYGE